MMQAKTVNQWAKHIHIHYLNSVSNNNINLNYFDYNMKNLMNKNNNGNFIVSSDFVSYIKLLLGLQDSSNFCRFSTLYIDDYPVIALKIHPNFVNGETYNIIVNPRESANHCIYPCKYFID